MIKDGNFKGCNLLLIAVLCHMNRYTSLWCTLLWQKRTKESLARGMMEGKEINVNMKESFCLNIQLLAWNTALSDGHCVVKRKTS